MRPDDIENLEYVTSLTSKALEKIDVLCYGHFNVIHPGHIRFLKFAAGQGHKLGVLLKSDKDFSRDSQSLYFTEEERRSSLAGLDLVSKVLSKGYLSFSECVAIIKPAVLILGHETEKEQSPEIIETERIVKDYGGSVIFHAGDKIDDLDFVNQSIQDIDSKNKRSLQAVCQRRNLKIERIQNVMEKFSGVKIVTLGDLIVDEFKSCEPLGLSSEAPVVVVRELESSKFTGGAGVVAAHVAALGGKSHLVSVCGDDLIGSEAAEDLDKKGVSHFLARDASRPTTHKTRYIADAQKLFRVSKLVDHDIGRDLEDLIIANVVENLGDADGLIISDFVYGVVTERVLAEIKRQAKAKSVKLFGDLQCSSQIGNVLQFTDFDLVFPTEKEARLAINDKDGSLEFVAQEVLRRSHCVGLALKLSSRGMIIYNNIDKANVDKEHFPALATKPVDVSGAGDSMLASMALAICSGASHFEASLIGTLTSYCEVCKMGNVPIGRNDLARKLEELYSVYPDLRN